MISRSAARRQTSISRRITAESSTTRILAPISELPRFPCPAIWGTWSYRHPDAAGLAIKASRQGETLDEVLQLPQCSHLVHGGAMPGIGRHRGVASVPVEVGLRVEPEQGPGGL